MLNQNAIDNQQIQTRPQIQYYYYLFQEAILTKNDFLACIFEYAPSNTSTSATVSSNCLTILSGL